MTDSCMSRISCPECVADMLDEEFTCPSCLYHMDRLTRLDYNIFWDPFRYRWYHAHLTEAEAWFWSACLAEFYPWVRVLLPQARIGTYRADFLLPDSRVIIEIDGFSNHSGAADITRDRQRQRWLQAQGYQVIRFSNTEILQSPGRCAAEADYLITQAGAR